MCERKVDDFIDDYIPRLVETQNRLASSLNFYRMYNCNLMPHTSEDFDRMEGLVKRYVRELKDGVLEVIAKFSYELEASKKEYRDDRRYNEIVMNMLVFADECNNEVIMNDWMKDLMKKTIENSGAN